MSLSTKILSMLLTVLGITLSLFGWWDIQKERDELKALLNDHGNSLARGLAVSILEPFLAEDYPMVDTILETLGKQTPDIVSIQVLQHGKIVSQYRGTPTDETDSTIFLSGVYVPNVHSSSRKFLGQVRLEWSNRRYREILADRTRQLSVNIAIIFLVLFLTLTILIRKLVLQKVSQLSRFTEEIAGGNLGASLDLATRDELGKLARAFDKMTKKLLRTTVSRNYVTKIINSMIDTLVVVTPEFQIQSVNRATCQLLGYSKEELTGKPAALLFGGSREFRTQVDLKQLQNRGCVLHAEITYVSKAGGAIPMLFSATTLESGTDTNQGFVFAAQDITELKRAREKLIHYATELERSNQDLQDFASVASHDLQEPLRKVILFGDRLREEHASSLDDRGVDYLDRIETSTLRMKRFIQDLLEYSRVTTKARPFERVDLEPVVADVLENLEAQIAQLGANAEMVRLPTLQADTMQMHQLFQNLISNGLKFHRKGIPPVIRIGHRSLGNGFVEIRLEDNGIGFDEKYLPQIFKPFEQLHGRGQFEGSGMGLSICKRIVKRHGGQITAHSEIDKGSTFIILLPESPGDGAAPCSANPLKNHP
ncbi:MAG: ATP-binding protein [Nitrospinaceae bacterium]